MVFPIILGKGMRLFQDGVAAEMKLVDTKTFESGVAVLTYAPASGK
jgi:dihydrofolate reductase